MASFPSSKKRPSAVADKTASSKVRRKVSRACNGCRDRKIKCDGKKPACGSCAMYGVPSECSYSTDQDHRRIPPKQYVKDLEHRVKFLESLLAERNAIGSFDSLDGNYGRYEDVEDGLSTEGEFTDEGDELSISAQSRLKIDDDTGEPRQYGPTSVFMHIPQPTGPFLSSPDPAADGDEENYRYIYSLRRSPSSTSSLTEDYHPNFNWEKNLPHLEGMDLALHDELLALFFTYFNDWCCWVNPSLFFHDMLVCLSWDGNPPCRTSFYSPMLHNAILSMAANFCDDRLGNEDRGKPFATRAIESIGIEGERPMLSTVSALMLLGSYHSGNAKQTLGYMYAGMGLRMCQTLGLGIDCSTSNLISPLLKRERDRTFYMAYIQDKLWGAYVGRSASMILSDHETPLPMVDDQQDKAPWIPVEQAKEISALSTPGTCAFPPSWASTNFLWTCKLAVLSERVTETVYSLHANLFSTRTQDTISTLNLQLGEWYSSLPPSLVISPYSVKIPPPHIITAHAMYHFVVILLHRPFYSGAHARKHLHMHELSVSRCDSAAAQIVHLIDLYRKTPGLRYGPISLTQMTFTAGTIHLLSAVSHESRRREKRFRTAIAGANECVRALREMGRTWQCATQSGQALQNMIRDWCPQEAKNEVAQPGSSVHPDSTVEHPAPANQMSLQETLRDPSSDLTKELLRLGWIPPTSQTHSKAGCSSAILTMSAANGTSTDSLPPSTFSTLDQLSILRGLQYEHPHDENPDYMEGLLDNSLHSSTFAADNSVWSNLTGVENSFGWGYTHNWEAGQSPYFMSPGYEGQ
ncbi:hypothetical protein L218DRAFT_1079168 [Marasmius fiardii PR-910]|nr:hypothetical protein L218DRAFT_1079168 [Marasmius fiardii PR-910]